MACGLRPQGCGLWGLWRLYLKGYGAYTWVWGYGAYYLKLLHQRLEAHFALAMCNLSASMFLLKDLPQSHTECLDGLAATWHPSGLNAMPAALIGCQGRHHGAMADE